MNGISCGVVDDHEELRSGEVDSLVLFVVEAWCTGLAFAVPSMVIVFAAAALTPQVLRLAVRLVGRRVVMYLSRGLGLPSGVLVHGEWFHGSGLALDVSVSVLPFHVRVVKCIELLKC